MSTPPPSPSLSLDHIAVVARTLDEGTEHVRDALGLVMPPGGAHPAMGTHNRLMALGPDLFLEVIAVDPSAPTPDRARWFALDGFDGTPKLGTWVLSTPDLGAALETMPDELGRAVPITRGTLSWSISVPDDGSMPCDGAFPSLIEWPDGSPAAGMVDLGCTLRSLQVEHPDADSIDAALAGRFADPRVLVRRGVTSRILAEIETPNGVRVLS